MTVYRIKRLFTERRNGRNRKSVFCGMKTGNDLVFNVAFWLLYFLYQWLGLSALYGDLDSYFINACVALPTALIFSVAAMNVFFKHYYLHDKKLLFYVFVIASTCLLLLTRRYFNYYVIYPRYFPHALNMPLWTWGKFLVDLVGLYSVASLYALYYFIGYWHREQTRVRELVQERTLAELGSLKAQVQPHFLFNTLNNIYSTALRASPETAKLIEHLSGLLDYNLYRVAGETVLLSDEMSYLDHYLQLEKNRYGKRLTVTLNMGDNLEGIEIPPLLLLPLVENCIKHGVAKAAGYCWVKVDVSLQHKELLITIENNRELMPTDDPSTGIGLLNVRKRLALIYPLSHELKIVESPDSFKIILKIQIAAL
jgi:two-component system, LytTR family, sensor kinase